MNLDLRIPMGLMFLITGGIMAIFGLITNGDPMYSKSQGMNINLIWGLIMFVFGTTMFVLGRRGQKKALSEPVVGTDRPLGGGHGLGH